MLPLGLYLIMVGLAIHFDMVQKECIDMAVYTIGCYVDYGNSMFNWVSTVILERVKEEV